MNLASLASLAPPGPGLLDALLEDYPLGLLILDHARQPVWHNQEAAIACAVWNRQPKGADQLPLESHRLVVPHALSDACQTLPFGGIPGPTLQHVEVVSAHDPGLLARISFLPAEPESFFVLRLDYRRPRADRDRAVSPRALAVLGCLTPREREVALRVRDGMSTAEIAGSLRRSPFTVKTQLASIFRKLGTRSRTQLAAMLYG